MLYTSDWMLTVPKGRRSTKPDTAPAHLPFAVYTVKDYELDTTMGYEEPLIMAPVYVRGTPVTSNVVGFLDWLKWRLFIGIQDLT